MQLSVLKTKTKEKHKDLTLQQIIPKWSKTLAMGRKLEGQQIKDMRNLQYCIVGEAHGNKDHYYTEITKYCKDCTSFSMELPYYYKEATLLTDKSRSAEGKHYLEMMLGEFVNHFNQEHKEEFYSRK